MTTPFSRTPSTDRPVHPRQRAILAIVDQQPGIRMSRVAAALGFGWGATLHHVRRLEREGQLCSIVTGRARALFLAAHPPRFRRRVAWSQHPLHAALLANLQARPWISQSELATLLNVDRPRVCRILRRLEAAEILVGKRDGRHRHYAALFPFSIEATSDEAHVAKEGVVK